MEGRWGGRWKEEERKNERRNKNKAEQVVREEKEKREEGEELKEVGIVGGGEEGYGWWEGRGGSVTGVPHAMASAQLWVFSEFCSLLGVFPACVCRLDNTHTRGT